MKERDETLECDDKELAEYAQKLLNTPQSWIIADLMVQMGIPNNEIGARVMAYLDRKRKIADAREHGLILRQGEYE